MTLDDRAWWVRLLRAAFAATGVFALWRLPGLEADGGPFNYANYFSYFTVLSNVAAVVVLGVGAVAAPTGPAWQWVRGLVTTAMVITGIVYALLLADIDVGLTTQWINDILHRLIPVVLLLDWAVLRPRRLPSRSWLTWMIYPLAYGVYTLCRGPFVDWYPYPFLDPRTQGYISMALSLIIVFIGMTAMSFGVYWLGRRGRDALETPPT